MADCPMLTRPGPAPAPSRARGAREADAERARTGQNRCGPDPTGPRGTGRRGAASRTGDGSLAGPAARPADPAAGGSAPGRTGTATGCRRYQLILEVLARATRRTDRDSRRTTGANNKTDSKEQIGDHADHPLKHVT